MSGLYFVEADECSDTLFEKWKSLALSQRHAKALRGKESPKELD
jgi:hypothetical protein